MGKVRERERTYARREPRNYVFKQSEDCLDNHIIESLILAQDERWRRA